MVMQGSDVLNGGETIITVPREWVAVSCAVIRMSALFDYEGGQP